MKSAEIKKSVDFFQKSENKFGNVRKLLHLCIRKKKECTDVQDKCILEKMKVINKLRI